LPIGSAIIGSQKDTVEIQKYAGTPNRAEEVYGDEMNRAYNEYRGILEQGPGASDVSSAVGSSRDLATLLEQYMKTGGLPGQGDIDQAQGLAGGMFNARRTALSQSMQDQEVLAAREAARLGRSTTDPVLQNKLRGGFMRQQDSLMAEQTDFGNRIAMDLPGRRLGFANDRANVLNNLAAQAFSNRAAILAAGSNLFNNERNARLGLASTTQLSGGGVKGAAAGYLGSTTAAMNFFGGMGGGGMGGGGGQMGGGGAGMFSGASASRSGYAWRAVAECTIPAM
jgi:hypothetical protein